jgi:hypothetical protein
MKQVRLLAFIYLTCVSMCSIACSCKRFTVENNADKANWIFSAKVIKLELLELKDESGRGLIEVGFTEIETIKGDLGLLTQLTTSTSTCGVNYEISSTYLIMANQDGFTDICTGTMQVVTNENHPYFNAFRQFIDELKAFASGELSSITEFYNPITRRTLNGPQKPVNSDCKKSGG